MSVRDHPTMELLHSERIIVRPWREDEADRVLDMLSLMEVVRWIDDDPQPLRTREQALGKISEWRQQTDARRGIGFWAVEEIGRAHAAGTVLLTDVPNSDGLIQIGWHLHPDSWGRGLAREAAAGVLTHGFAHGIDPIHALMFTDNDPSAKVCRAIGMRDEGIINDQWYPGPSRHFVMTAADNCARSGARL